MQTTLLGLRLRSFWRWAALVGPHFCRLGRLPRSRGAREPPDRLRVPSPARSMPACAHPTLMPQGIEFGRPGDSSKVRACTSRFALGALRGEWRMARTRGSKDLNSPSGWTAPAAWPGGALDRLRPGRRVDPAAPISRTARDPGGRRQRLAPGARQDRVQGELRPLAAGQRRGRLRGCRPPLPYRLAMSRVADDGGVGCASISIRSSDRSPPTPTSRSGSTAAHRASKAASPSRGRSVALPRAGRR